MGIKEYPFQQTKGKTGKSPARSRSNISLVTTGHIVATVKTVRKRLSPTRLDICLEYEYICVWPHSISFFQANNFIVFVISTQWTLTPPREWLWRAHKIFYFLNLKFGYLSGFIFTLKSFTSFTSAYLLAAIQLCK